MPVDLALWLALASEGGFVYSPEVLQGYRVHAAQMSSTKETIARNTREVVHLLRDACAAGEEKGLGLQRLRRTAVREHLGSTAIHDAFGGNTWLAVYRCLTALRHCPYDALTSRKLWIAALRIAVGERIFGLLRPAEGSLVEACSRPEPPAQQSQ